MLTGCATADSHQWRRKKNTSEWTKKIIINNFYDWIRDETTEFMRLYHISRCTFERIVCKCLSLAAKLKQNIQPTRNRRKPHTQYLWAIHRWWKFYKPINMAISKPLDLLAESTRLAIWYEDKIINLSKNKNKIFVSLFGMLSICIFIKTYHLIQTIFYALLWIATHLSFYPCPSFGTFTLCKCLSIFDFASANCSISQKWFGLVVPSRWDRKATENIIEWVPIYWNNISKTAFVISANKYEEMYGNNKIYLNCPDEESLWARARTRTTVAATTKQRRILIELNFCDERVLKRCECTNKNKSCTGIEWISIAPPYKNTSNESQYSAEKRSETELKWLLKSQEHFWMKWDTISNDLHDFRRKRDEAKRLHWLCTDWRVHLSRSDCTSFVCRCAGIKCKMFTKADNNNSSVRDETQH